MIAILKCQLKFLYLSRSVKVVALVCLERNAELPRCDAELVMMSSLCFLETITLELTVDRPWRSEVRLFLQH